MFEQKNTTKDLRSILYKYLRFWYLFVISGAISVAVAIIYLRYATPLYQSHTTIILKDDNKSGGSELAVFSEIAAFNTNRNMDDELFILKSKSLMERVVKELKLEIAFFIDGNVRDVEVYGADMPVQIIIKDYLPSFYGKSFYIHFKDDNSFELRDDNVEVYRFGDEIRKPYGVFTIVSQPDFTSEKKMKPIRVVFRDYKSLAASYANRLNVMPLKKKEGGAVAISITDPVPERGQDLLNKLLEVYEREKVEDKNEIARKSLDFIEERLRFLTQEITGVEKNVQQYKQLHELTDISSQGQEYVQSAIATRKQLEEVEVQLDILWNIENYLKSQGDNDNSLVPSSLSINDVTLSSLINSFNQLQLDRERLLRTERPNNPNIINMNEQLKNLKANILENLKNIRAGLSITRRSLLAKSGVVGDKIQNVPVIEREFIEITRQQDTKQALYLYLLQKKEESALSLASAVSNTRTIDPPSSFGPVWPNKTNTVAYAGLLGLFIPFLGIYLKNLISNKIEFKHEVEKLTKTPILGEICHEKSDDPIVANAHKRTPIAEMFRLIRSNLRFSLAGKENQVVLITSSMSGEGKTFFSVNIGVSLAGAGKKVLIIEFDLRRPKLLKTMGLPKSKGLTDYLVGDIQELDSIITPSGIEDNLHVIPAGTLPPNPAEIILSDKVGELISDMRQRYDYVFIDSPPVGKVADALTLNAHIDTAIYLVRYNYTEKDQLQIIDDIFENKKLKNPLIVLNDSKKLNSGNYVYGY